MKLILLTQVFATLFMVGLIWFVQIVHYPLYANVGHEQFPEYEALHNRMTTWVVGPAMLVELVTAVLLLKYSPHASAPPAWMGLGLLIVIWISTAALSVPAHDVLAAGFSAGAYRKLLSTNWIRTVAWTARGVIVMVITYRNLGTDGTTTMRNLILVLGDQLDHVSAAFDGFDSKNDVVWMAEVAAITTTQKKRLATERLLALRNNGQNFRPLANEDRGNET